MTQSLPVDDADLVQRFESLGDNCEFGLLQRHAGAEPLGLLRFNFTGLPQLIAGLDKKFSDLAAPGHVQLTWTDEWMVSETVYKFSYHTFNKNKDYGEERLANEQGKTLRYLARKFMEDLAAGERIYVRKGEGQGQGAEIRALHAALRQHGPAVLLWVTEADATHPAGTVRLLGDGLIRGWMSKFASYINAPDLDAVGWIKLLRRAWSLHYLKDADAYPAPARPSVIAPEFGGWSGSAQATAEFAWDIPAPPGGAQMMRHVLVSDLETEGPLFSWYLTSGLTAGTLYVASADIWLPADFAGAIDLVFLGRASLRNSKPNLALRRAWQKIYVSARLEDVSQPVVVRLNARGPAGSALYSANWRVEAGGIPS